MTTIKQWEERAINEYEDVKAKLKRLDLNLLSQKLSVTWKLIPKKNLMNFLHQRAGIFSRLSLIRTLVARISKLADISGGGLKTVSVILIPMCLHWSILTKCRCFP